MVSYTIVPAVGDFIVLCGLDTFGKIKAWASSVASKISIPFAEDVSEPIITPSPISSESNNVRGVVISKLFISF